VIEIQSETLPRRRENRVLPSTNLGCRIEAPSVFWGFVRHPALFLPPRCACYLASQRQNWYKRHDSTTEARAKPYPRALKRNFDANPNLWSGQARTRIPAHSRQNSRNRRVARPNWASLGRPSVAV